MEFNTKYYRKLENFDFEKINKNSFQKLIDEGIFDEFELSKTYKNDEDYFINDNDIMGFGDFYIFNRKEYHLKKDIYAEMIYVKNWYFEAFNSVDVLIEEIEVLVVSEFQLENKLKILEENFKKYFNQINDKQYYPLFKDGTLTSGYESWEQYFISDIEENENYTSVTKFLKGEYNFLNPEIENQWNDYLVFSKISDYCEKKKNSLLNIKENNLANKNSNIDLSFQISLLEEIINLKNWSEITATKKGEILTNLLGKNKDNIKKIYLEFDKKTSEISNKTLKDREKASELIKKLLG